MVLPSSKAKKTKSSLAPVSKKKPLTKKQKKELQKVLERKEKKAQVLKFSDRLKEKGVSLSVFGAEL